MNTDTQQLNTITIQEVKNLRYHLPYGWRSAAGILKNRKQIDPLKYQKEIRQEWEKR